MTWPDFLLRRGPEIALLATNVFGKKFYKIGENIHLTFMAVTLSKKKGGFSSAQEKEKIEANQGRHFKKLNSWQETKTSVSGAENSSSGLLLTFLEDKTL